MIAKVKATGEIIDVWRKCDGWVRMTEPKAWIKPHEVELLGYTFDEVEEIKQRTKEQYENGIDWAQRRYEIAKELMRGFATNPHNMLVDAKIGTLAEWSVSGADSLIAELKKGGTE